MNNLQQYLHRGLLKEQPPDFRQIERQILRAEKDLHTLGLVIKEDPVWASTIAYQAMLRAGRALLFSEGVLPSDGRQHKTVIEVTGKFLGGEYKVLVQQFERLRRKRNVFFYDSEESVSATEAVKTIQTAKTLLTTIKQHIRAKSPQTSFNF
jgi:uncharacterized protein (UPF0332 family)